MSLIWFCQELQNECRHLERRFPVSGLEKCPGCHPERSEGSLRPARQTQSSRSGCMEYPHRQWVSASTSCRKRPVKDGVHHCLFATRCPGHRRLTMWVLHTLRVTRIISKCLKRVQINGDNRDSTISSIDVILSQID